MRISAHSPQFGFAIFRKSMGMITILDKDHTKVDQGGNNATIAEGVAGLMPGGCSFVDDQHLRNIGAYDFYSPDGKPLKEGESYKDGTLLRTLYRKAKEHSDLVVNNPVEPRVFEMFENKLGDELNLRQQKKALRKFKRQSLKNPEETTSELLALAQKAYKSTVQEENQIIDEAIQRKSS